MVQHESSGGWQKAEDCCFPIGNRKERLATTRSPVVSPRGSRNSLPNILDPGDPIVLRSIPEPVNNCKKSSKKKKYSFTSSLGLLSPSPKSDRVSKRKETSPSRVFIPRGVVPTLPARKKSAPNILVRSTTISCYSSPFVDGADIVKIELIASGSESKLFKCSVDGLICVMKEMVYITAPDDGMGEITILDDVPKDKHIIRYYGYQQYRKGTIKLYIPLYDSSLDALILSKRKENGSFSSNEIIDIITQVAAGLAVLHRHKIIHRGLFLHCTLYTASQLISTDIKSHNIFYSIDIKAKKTFVIGDFGISAKNDKKHKTIIGTPSFMAPEVFGDLPYSYPVDVFAFGMLIFELLTLNMPYSDVKSFNIVEKIQQGVQPTLPSLSASYQPIIMLHRNCIGTNPQHRPTMPQVCQKLAAMGIDK